jgi:hypothetical protein
MTQTIITLEKQTSIRIFLSHLPDCSLKKEPSLHNFQWHLYTKSTCNLYKKKEDLSSLTFVEISSNGNNLHPFINVDLTKSYNKTSFVFLFEYKITNFILSDILNGFMCIFQNLLTPFTFCWCINFRMFFIRTPNCIRTMT